MSENSNPNAYSQQRNGVGTPGHMASGNVANPLGNQNGHLIASPEPPLANIKENHRMFDTLRHDLKWWWNTPKRVYQPMREGPTRVIKCYRCGELTLISCGDEPPFCERCWCYFPNFPDNAAERLHLLWLMLKEGPECNTPYYWWQFTKAVAAIMVDHRGPTPDYHFVPVCSPSFPKGTDWCIVSVPERGFGYDTEIESPEYGW